MSLLKIAFETLPPSQRSNAEVVSSRSAKLKVAERELADWPIDNCCYIGPRALTQYACTAVGVDLYWTRLSVGFCLADWLGWGINF